MFKDYKKYLETSLKVYLFVLLIIFILKIVGLDYFNVDEGNLIINKFNTFAQKYNLIDIYYGITMIIYAYVILSTTCNDNSKKMKIYVICITPLLFFIKIITTKIGNTWINLSIDILHFLLFSIIYTLINKGSIIKICKRYIFIFLLNFLFQLISAITRISNLDTYQYGFVKNVILDIDYLLLSIIFYKFYFMKGGILCSVTEVGSYLRKKINLKKSLKKLLKSFQNSIEGFKKQSKQEKITIIIFTILSFIWNTITVLIVLFIAKINDTFIECIFILTSFWLSKRSFGKAFHFDSMIVCFIVSNLTYYILNRITSPLGISIIVPILLGVGLSYITSKFVKKTYKPLYRGMPRELFEETILKVADRDSDKYNICYEFYIEKKSDVSLSYKYNYSVAGIRKIKDRINDKIKRL